MTSSRIGRAIRIAFIAFLIAFCLWGLSVSTWCYFAHPEYTEAQVLRVMFGLPVEGLPW